jgi:HD-GYP domain-containing protein (c-di-GMP phosphodiesterase class II)
MKAQSPSRDTAPTAAEPIHLAAVLIVGAGPAVTAPIRRVLEHAGYACSEWTAAASPGGAPRSARGAFAGSPAARDVEGWLRLAARGVGGGALAGEGGWGAGDDGRGAEVAASLAAAVQYRDGETGAHLARVGLYAAALARELGWDDEAAADLRVAAGIHDVGKLGVPDQILLKPSPLDPAELTLMRRHAEIGAAIIGASAQPVLRLGREIALHHHERWDGGGYPRGLAGEAIPAAARIVAVADVYDSLVNSRVYRPPMDEDEALELMAGEAGAHFDPEVFDRFFDLLPEVRRIQRELQE